MFNIILTYFGYIISYPWLFSAGNKDTKRIEKIACRITPDIKSIYVKNTCISNIYAVDTYIKYASFGGACTRFICTKKTLVRNIKLRALVKSRVILAD